MAQTKLRGLLSKTSAPSRGKIRRPILGNHAKGYMDTFILVCQAKFKSGAVLAPFFELFAKIF